MEETKSGIHFMTVEPEKLLKRLHILFEDEPKTSEADAAVRQMLAAIAMKNFSDAQTETERYEQKRKLSDMMAELDRAPQKAVIVVRSRFVSLYTGKGSVAELDNEVYNYAARLKLPTLGAAFDGTSFALYAMNRTKECGGIWTGERDEAELTAENLAAVLGTNDFDETFRMLLAAPDAAGKADAFSAFIPLTVESTDGLTLKAEWGGADVYEEEKSGAEK